MVSLADLPSFNTTIQMTDLASLRSIIESALCNFLFATNDQMMRHRVVNELSTILMQAKGQGLVWEYRVVCDETNNTFRDFDLHVDIYLKPVRSIEIKVWNFALTNNRIESTPMTVVVDYEERRSQLLDLCEVEI
jgi:hypothetical protein